jgi:hypothetical protein
VPPASGSGGGSGSGVEVRATSDPLGYNLVDNRPNCYFGLGASYCPAPGAHRRHYPQTHTAF